MIDAASECLRLRESEAARRLRNAAWGLGRAVVAAGLRAAREHPWALPSLGFCGGLLGTLLLADRRDLLEDDFHES